MIRRARIRPLYPDQFTLDPTCGPRTQTTKTMRPGRDIGQTRRTDPGLAEAIQAGAARALSLPPRRGRSRGSTHTGECIAKGKKAHALRHSAVSRHPLHRYSIFPAKNSPKYRNAEAPRVLISMMVRSTKGSNQRPDTLMRERNSEKSSCKRTAGPYIGSLAPDRQDRDTRTMSASHPTASEN